jgi:hypothetical protein
VNLNGQRPSNHLRFQRESVHFSGDFGDLHSITPRNLVGEGHSTYLEIRTCYGLRLDVTPEWLAALVRQAPAALAKLPYLPEVHDAVGVDE